MKRILTLLVFLIALSAQGWAQAPVIEWQKCLGSFDGDYAHSIEPTRDGGYIIAGYTENDGGDVMGYHGNAFINDYWVVKMNHDGGVQWQKCLGGFSFDQGSDIHQTSDGGYIVAGSSSSNSCGVSGNHGGLDYWIVKLDDKGEIQWQKSYGGSKNEYAYAISIAPDGGYIVAGQTESQDGDVSGNKGDWDYWIIKIDATGQLIWQRTAGGSGYEDAYGLKATTDGGCIVVGFTESNDGDVTGNHGKRDVWVVRLDKLGKIVWEKTYGGSQFELAWSVQQTTDGGFVVCGTTSSNDGDVSGNHGSDDVWVLKLTASGTLQWQKCYGGQFNESGFYIQGTADGGYVFTGSAESSNGDLICNAGNQDVWLAKINSAGNIQWQKSMGGSGWEEGYCVQPVNDGGFIVAGASCSPMRNGYHPHQGSIGTCPDFWIIKLSDPLAPAPQAKVKISPASATVCQNGKGTLTTTTQYTGTDPSYAWLKNGQPVGKNDPSYQAEGLKNNDVIICTVTSGGECGRTSRSSDTVVIQTKVNTNPPVITISADDTAVCQCMTVTFKASVAHGGPSPQYQWRVSGKSMDNNSNVFVSSALNAGDVVYCTYIDNLICQPTQSNSITILANTGQDASVKIDPSTKLICPGMNVSFTATVQNVGGSPTYQWKINGLNAGSNSNIFSSATLKTGDMVSCTVVPDPLYSCGSPTPINSNTINITISPLLVPTVKITTSSDTICPGASPDFVAAFTNAGNQPSFQWMVNNQNAGTNSEYFTTNSLQNGDVVTCTMLADPAFGCSASPFALSNSINITVKQGLLPSVTITPPTDTLCHQTTASFSALAQNVGVNPSYQWKINQLPVGLNQPTYSSSSFRNGDQLSCTVFPGPGSCTSQPASSNVVNIFVADPIVVKVSPADTLVTPGSQVQLSSSFSRPPVSYAWNPADLLTNAVSTSVVTVPVIRNSVITLTTIDENGCSSGASSSIHLFIPFYMPNAFTPNGDGINDLYRIPPYVLVDVMEFSIYDRWGNKVFATNDRNKGWDGRVGGSAAATGVYIFMIRLHKGKDEQLYKGSFLLMR
ncbi:MAG: gliding motility-associated C-terminal domain-containing protein [Flavisolibacter sp.]